MNISSIHIAYFIGVGGIGMSALARWYKQHDIKVYGYDKTPSELTRQLESEGIQIHYEDSIENIPAKIKEKTEGVLVIYTPAIPDTHMEFNFLKINGYTVVKRSEALGLITSGYFTIAVAGTHGKTTTSAMIAHLLAASGKNVLAFLGGIPTNYGTNFIQNLQGEGDPIVVVEADEFDRSFLTLHPNIAVLTSCDPDHLDIYGAHKDMLDSFNAFISQIKPQGVLIAQQEAKNAVQIPEGIFVEDYAIAPSNSETITIKSSSPKVRNGAFEFDYTNATERIANAVLPMPGIHNVLNSVAAISCALKVGVTTAQVKAALASFKGVKRRFEKVIETEKTTYIDDYAHHPSEINAFVDSLRLMYPKRHITLVFQPHLFSRTRDFASGFSQALSKADRVLLLDIYPARELPIPGITSAIVFEPITCEKIAVKKSDLLATLEGLKLDVLATVGAGDIDRFVSPIKEKLA